MPEPTHRTVLRTHTVVETAGDADYHKRTVLWVADQHLGAVSRVRGPAAIQTRVFDETVGSRLGFSTFGSLADDMTN